MPAAFSEEKILPPGMRLLRLAGHINANNAPEVRAEVTGLLSEGYKTFVFDFSEVADIDSVGIGAFFTMAKLSTDAGGSVRIFGATTLIKKTLELAHLTRYVSLYADLEAALAGRAEHSTGRN